MKILTLKEKFEQITTRMKLDKLPDLKNFVLSAMQSAYDLAKSENNTAKKELEMEIDKLYSAFIKSLLDSGAYTATSLKENDPCLLLDVFEYWAANLPQYTLPTPTKQ
jgi:hypothetical protein